MADEDSGLFDCGVPEPSDSDREQLREGLGGDDSEDGIAVFAVNCLVLGQILASLHAEILSRIILRANSGIPRKNG